MESCKSGFNSPGVVHQWKLTGAFRHHVVWHNGKPNQPPPKIATYLKCEICGCVGFRYDPRRVVYTWEQ
jgi:hypothetical protein